MQTRIINAILLSTALLLSKGRELRSSDFILEQSLYPPFKGHNYTFYRSSREFEFDIDFREFSETTYAGQIVVMVMWPDGNISIIPNMEKGEQYFSARVPGTTGDPTFCTVTMFTGTDNLPGRPVEPPSCTTPVTFQSINSREKDE
jgi:hypothetical protein